MFGVICSFFFLDHVRFLHGSPPVLEVDVGSVLKGVI